MLELATFIVLVITAASNVWSAYETRRANFHYARGNEIALGEGKTLAENVYKPSRWPQLTMIALTVLTWSAVGFDYYDRHPNWAVKPVTQAELDKPLEQVWGKTFINERIALDGKEYVDCTFQNVMFDYEGTASFRLTNCHFTPGGDTAFGSRNPIVKQAMFIANFLNQSGTTKTQSNADQSTTTTYLRFLPNENSNCAGSLATFSAS